MQGPSAAVLHGRGLVFYPQFVGGDHGPPRPLNEVEVLGHGRFTAKGTATWGRSAAS